MKHIITFALLFVALSLSAQQPITWPAYRDSVLVGAQEMQQAEETLKGAEYTKKATISGYLPSINLTGDASYDFVKTDFLGSQLNPFNYSVGASLKQNIYAGGSVIANRKIAKDQMQIAQYTKEQTMEQLLYQADVAYWQLAAYRQVEINAKNYYAIVETLFNIINLRFDDGMLSKSDLLMVNTRLKEAELNLISAQQSVVVAEQTFNILMNVTPDAPIDLADSINYQLPLPQLKTVEDVLNDNMTYRILETNIDLQKQQVNQTRSNFNPNIYAGFNAGWGTPLINVSGSPVWKATILLSVSYPLLQWGKRYNTVNSAKTEVIKLQLQQGIVKDNISLQLNNAKTKLSENYKQIQIAYENLNIAAENMDLNTLRYNEGQLPILDVLSSQLSWIQANNSYVSALLAYKIAYAEYQYVSGAIDNGVQQP